ncbi:restriction endonuclease subunit S [Proteus mirabilis]|uniref:restriction endonuclease subunit S n=1 Tax=Proteus mirabilis TaxID=584 RepID=UPI0021824C6F|nr:restriction endonuclease subunit S [Proteus mirabilis]MCT0087432.1 restriction endonuclease subunit S [Proteus mirabilis]
MTNYESLPLGELGKIVTGKTPKTENPENFGADYMFIGPTDLHKHFFITSSERMISAKGLESIKSSALNGVSVLVGCIGWDMGNVGVVEGKCATNQQINSITNIHENYNPLYIYYWLKTKKDFLYQQASVTRTPILNKTDFSSIRINIPKERKYQDKVVGLLAAIDKKIELNNRINAELEAMAKTLYDYWFVQFDFPDANGKPYKTSGGKMVYNPTLKREIPEDWKVDTLASWIESDKTGDWGKEEQEGNYTLQVDCIRGADINGLNGSGKIAAPNRFILKKNDHKLLAPFDLVIEISGGSPTQSTGRMAYITDDVLDRFTHPLICSNFCKAISLRNKDLFYCFAYLWNDLYGNGVLFGWEGKTSGIKNLLFDSFVTKHQVPIPPMGLAKKFFDFVAPLEQKKQTLLKENARLESLRDWLLPMLMNGQVTVGEAS